MSEHEKDAWIRTPSRMEGVCVGTVVRSASGTIACRYNKDLAVLLGDERPIPWRALSLPLQVLWDPRTPPASTDEDGPQ